MVRKWKQEVRISGVSVLSKSDIIHDGNLVRMLAPSSRSIIAISMTLRQCGNQPVPVLGAPCSWKASIKFGSRERPE
jgi:hypothetical protein